VLHWVVHMSKMPSCADEAQGEQMRVLTWLAYCLLSPPSAWPSPSSLFRVPPGCTAAT
jgi:hypothetical protein